MKTLKNIHPGEVLREEFLSPMGITAYRLAKDIGIPQTRIASILKGTRRITADTALRFSKYFGNSAKFWLGLQNDFDLEEVSKSEKVMYEIDDEDMALKALHVAEEQLEYRSFTKVDRNDIIKKLKRVLQQFKGIRQAWIYGSFARRDDTPESDIDVALKTDESFSYFDLAAVQHEAEKLVNRKVDVGFIDTFKPYIFEHVKPDLKLIYER